MFVIPVEDIRQSGNNKQITLRLEKSLYANNKTFDTSKYLVTL